MNSVTGKIYSDSIKDFATSTKDGKTNNAIFFKLIVQEVWKDKDGNKQEGTAVFQECVAYGKTAELVKKHAGSLVTCAFTLKQETYVNKTHADVTHYVTKFVIKFINEVWNNDSKSFEKLNGQAAEVSDDMPF